MSESSHPNQVAYHNVVMEAEDHPNSMEDRTLALLQDSKVDQAIGEQKARKRGGRKHKAQWMKKPMALSEVILELYEEDLRENALRCLSNYLNDRRELEPEKYSKAGFFVFHACGIMAILLQEVLSAYQKMETGNLNIRSSKRLANVLTLFQSIAANKETRGKLVDAHIPNYLIPFILFENIEDYIENVRAICLSVFGIIVQAREAEIIQWALKSNIVDVCLHAIEIGNELSKVIAMHIIESILQDNCGISYVCESTRSVLGNLLEICKRLVLVSVGEQDLSPRLLFHIIRFYILLCNNSRALDLIKDNLPPPLLDNTFHEITEEFPVINQLLNQLLLNVGKVEEVDIKDRTATVYRHAYCQSKSMSLCPSTPLKPINMNREYWSSAVSHSPISTFSGKEN